MKPAIFICFFLFLSIRAFSQYTPCPEIQFTYDASGNRIERAFVIVNCYDNTHHRYVPPDSSSNLSTKIYPNPTIGLINIDININDTACSEPTLIYLFDANSQTIFSKKIASHYIKLDVSSLAQGTYIVKVICCNYQSSSVVLKTNNISGNQTVKAVTEIVK